MARDFGLSEIFFVNDGLAPRHFDRLAGRGVAWVELVWHPVIGALDERRARQSAERLAAVGVACHSVHAPFSAEHDPSSLDSRIRAGTLDAYRRCLDLLHGLGGRVLVVHPGYEPIGPGRRQDRLRYSADLLAQTGALCDQAGVTLAVENLHHGPIGRSPQELDAVLDGWSHGRHGVCFDVAHAFCDVGVAAFLRDLASPIQVAESVRDLLRPSDVDFHHEIDYHLHGAYFRHRDSMISTNTCRSHAPSSVPKQPARPQGTRPLSKFCLQYPY